ncbi:adipocyte plasma membrane-associated protein [Aplysia californica]|uniref:Adipocyte plasma membrane-associated protein n=1 Tax=Aplysia californica TaxID=6500 RepID=A0ABM1A4V7_APLCA|nr:adipocyte plasma membrane-associated protein [Aplysia californica]
MKLPPPPALSGTLATNNVLYEAERVHDGQIAAPHSYVPLGDSLFAVTKTGLVINVAPCRPVLLADLKPRGCRSPKECGHPVSMRLNADKHLIVVDAYRGLFDVDPVTGFDPGNRQVKEILVGLAYPSGLELTTDGQALLVSERRTMQQLKMMYHKRGMAVELDDRGRVRSSVHDPTGLKVSEVMEVKETDGMVYIGSRDQDAIIRFPLPKSYGTDLSVTSTLQEIA